MNKQKLELEALHKYVDIGYFKNKGKREGIRRDLKSRIAAWELGEEYYDGSRSNGYGGFVDDGRWIDLLKNLLQKCNQLPLIKSKQEYSMLDLGCKKGFIVDAANSIDISGIGVESHDYPLENARESIKHRLIRSNYTELPFVDNSFDFCIAFSSIYMLNIGDVMKCLKEIMRVSRESYITVGAYNEPWEKEVFEEWTLIGTTVLHTSEWLELFEAVGYESYYYFTTPESLGLTKRK